MCIVNDFKSPIYFCKPLYNICLEQKKTSHFCEALSDFDWQ